MDKEIQLDPTQILALRNLNRRPEVLFSDDTTLEMDIETIFDEVKQQETEAPIRITVKIITQKIRRITVKEYDPEKSYSDGVKAFTDEVNPKE